MKQSRTLALSMVFIMGLGSISFADGTTTTAVTTTVPATTTEAATTNAPVVKSTITYEKALEMMLLKNSELLSLEGQLKLQDDLIKESEDEAKRYRIKLGTVEKDLLDDAKIVYLNPLTAKNTKSQLVRSIADKKVELKEKLIKYHIDWKSYKSEIALGNEVLKVQQKEYNNQALQYKLGKISSKDLATANSNLTIAKSDLQKVIRKMDLLLLDYNVLISNSYKLAFEPDEKSIVSVLKIGAMDFSTANFEKIVAANVANDSALAKIDEEVAVIEVEKRLDHLYSGSGVNLVEYEKKVKANKDDHAARVLAIEYQVYSDYYTMMSLQSDIDSINENMKLLEMQFKISEAQYKVGRLTELGLLKAKKDIQQAEHSLFVAKYGLYNAYNSFTKNTQNVTTK